MVKPVDFSKSFKISKRDGFHTQVFLDQKYPDACMIAKYGHDDDGTRYICMARYRLLVDDMLERKGIKTQSIDKVEVEFRRSQSADIDNVMVFKREQTKPLSFPCHPDDQQDWTIKHIDGEFAIYLDNK